MSVALAIAAGVALSAGSPPAYEGGVADLMREACVETEMRRDALESVARTRGWRPQRMTSPSPNRAGWNLAFRTPDALVLLTQVPDFAAGDPLSGSLCTVSVDRASPGLAAEVAALAASLGMETEAPAADIPAGGLPVRTWSRFGDRTLSFAMAPDGRATLSLSRQIVTHEPAPVSAPGN